MLNCYYLGYIVLHANAAKKKTEKETMVRGGAQWSW